MTTSSTDLVSKRNGLPIRRGTIIIAGPDNPYDPAWVSYYVVNPDAGHVLDVSNNVFHLDPSEMKHYFVLTREVIDAEWFKKDYPNTYPAPAWDIERYMSEICAGVHDWRFQ